MGKILTDSDEATIFVLAGCAVDMAIFTANGQLQKAAKAMGNVANVLAKDRAFLKRFKKAQEAVMDEFNKGLS